jgi:hypothetical protein
MKTIKSIETKDFQVTLVETEYGYEIFWNNGPLYNESEVISDYRTASYLFDLKVEDLL